MSPSAPSGDLWVEEGRRDTTMKPAWEATTWGVGGRVPVKMKSQCGSTVF